MSELVQTIIVTLAAIAAVVVIASRFRRPPRVAGRGPAGCGSCPHAGRARRT